MLSWGMSAFLLSSSLLPSAMVGIKSKSNVLKRTCIFGNSLQAAAARMSVVLFIHEYGCYNNAIALGYIQSYHFTHFND